MTQNAIVAGAGIWGCTVARRLAEAGRKVLVLEKRPVVGGNCRCEIDPATNIEVHAYGSHIFHTRLPDVWAFVNRFASFNGYQHKVLARHGGKTYFLPLGLALVNEFFGVELKPSEVAAFMADEAHARAVFDAFFRNYTSKQWGLPPEKVDPSIIRRVPVRCSYDVNYFDDFWQGIPTDGYNRLFERMLDHPNVEVRCGEAFALPPGRTSLPCPVYYSGPLDALFGYRFGPLPWRTLRFETERLPVADAQGTSVVNYVDADVPFTRQHEFRHYHPEPVGPLSQAKGLKSGTETIVMREYPAAWRPGDEPYYPVNNEESAALLAKYRAEAAKVRGLVVGGRLGEFRYLDMDRTVESALNIEIDGGRDASPLRPHPSPVGRGASPMRPQNGLDSSL